MNRLIPKVQHWIFALAMCCSFSVFGQFHVKPFDISKKITALENTKEGYLIYGTETGEFGRYDGIQFTRIDNIGAVIHQIETLDGKQILCTSKGMYQYSDNKITQISRNNLSVLDHSIDNTFLVTTNGVYTGSNGEHTPEKEEFYDINDIAFGNFFEIGDKKCFRADHKLYVKDKRWTELLSHGQDDFCVIPWNDTKMVVADRKALVTFDTEGYVDTLLHLGVETPNKIFKLSSSTLLLCAGDNIGIFDMRKRELNNFYSLATDLISSAVVDEWGNIWIAAGSYLFQIIDRSSEKINQPPIISIETIRLNGNKVDLDSKLRLDEDDNEIELNYDGVHMSFPQDLEFQTKLTRANQSIAYGEFDNTGWSSPSKDKSIEYRDLKAGKYSFQVRGSVDGQYYMYTTPKEFSVQSDFFQSIWLIGILGALGILLVALFFNNRYNTLKSKSEQDRKRLVQENKMLTLQQKALQLQMNPHFVFNSLNSIQGLIAKEDNQKARRYLQEFSTMMRSVLNQSRAETILIEDEIKYLKSYLNLEQMANNQKFDWEVEVGTEVEEDIRIPTMLIQPFVENAIIHGVKNLIGRKGKIQVVFEMGGAKMKCKIMDNGIGRKAAAELKSSSHKSVALDVVRERLTTKLGKSKETPIQYKDILNEENQVMGTQVSLSIPIMN